MKNLQAKLKEIFEPRTEEYWKGKEENTKSKGFEIKGFEDGKGGYFILDTGTREIWKTTQYETMIDFASELLIRKSLLCN